MAEGLPAGSASGEGGTDREAAGRGAPWYRDGLRFECTMCGNCCTGPEGVVWFTAAEGRAMAEALGIAEADFYRDYARRLDNRWTLVERVVERGGRALHDCVFLDHDLVPGKAVCRVYQARPGQCRTWPFWPENLTSRRAWESAKRRAPCPGMDTGRLYSVDEIRLRGRER